MRSVAFVLIQPGAYAWAPGREATADMPILKDLILAFQEHRHHFPNHAIVARPLQGDVRCDDCNFSATIVELDLSPEAL